MLSRRKRFFSSFLLTTALLLSNQGQAANSTPLGGPLMEPVDLYTVLSMNDSISPSILEQFTGPEKMILQQISVYKDAIDNNSYYTVKPIRALGNWAESKQFINFNAVSKVYRALETLGELDQISMERLVKYASTTDTSKSIEESKVFTESFKNIQAEARATFVSTLQLQAAALNAGQDSIKSFEDALRFLTILLNVPVAQFKLTAAPAYSLEKIEVIEKFRKVAPQINFFMLQSPGESPVYNLVRPVQGSPSVGETPEDKNGVLQTQYDILSGMNNKSLSNSLQQNIAIATAGTVVGFDLYYNLVAGFGDTPTEYGINDARFDFIGAFERKQPISVNFEGKVKCKFDAKIKDGYVFEIDKQNKYIVNDASHRTETSEEGINLADCKLYRSDDVAISDSKGAINLALIPPNLGQNADTARKLTALLEQRTAEYKNAFSDKYYAAQSLKNEIINAAVKKANGWKMIPISMREETKYKWGTRQECTQVPYQGACLKSEKRWRWQGLRSSYYTTCVQFETLYQNDCKDVQDWIAYTLDVPIPVRYVDKVEFDKHLVEETVYDLKFNDVHFAKVFAPNEICVERKFLRADGNKKVFDRVECSASGVRAIEKTRFEDTPAVERPVAGGESDDPFAGRLTDLINFDPFS